MADEKVSFAHVIFRSSTGFLDQDSPLPAAVQQPGDQVSVNGGTHSPWDYYAVCTNLIALMLT